MEWFQPPRKTSGEVFERMLGEGATACRLLTGGHLPGPAVLRNPPAQGERNSRVILFVFRDGGDCKTAENMVQ